MLATTYETRFLHTYNVDLGSWQEVTLDSPVSPHSLEAMNLILSKDGILAYIGTRLEFGHYLSELAQENGRASPFCWTSCPTSTIMSFLGLCLNTEIPGKPEMVFYGSPLTRMLAFLLSREEHRLLIMNELSRKGWFDIPEDGATCSLRVFANELPEALSYLND